MKSLSIPIQLDASLWSAIAPGGTALELDSVKGALRMKFDFNAGLGFVVARHVLSGNLPKEYALAFHLRGSGAGNDLEIKLVDKGGSNVWRYECKDVQISSRGRSFTIHERDFAFAWGPAGGGEIRELGAIEIAVVARTGGKGNWLIRDLVLADESLRRAPLLKYSSARKRPSADLRQVTNWLAESGDFRPALQIDFREQRLIGALIMQWKKAAPEHGFRVMGSNTGKAWRILYQTDKAGGVMSIVPLPNKSHRMLILELRESEDLECLSWQGFEFCRSRESFWHEVAARFPRGWHPRWLMREQSLWTPVGHPEGSACALINEQGMVEPGRASFSIEPFLMHAGKLITWADVEITQSLKDQWMPVPCVAWNHSGWRMEVMLQATECASLRCSYRVFNSGKKPMSIQLMLALRPFQVCPPWQHFRDVGGISLISDLQWHEGQLSVNGRHHVFPSQSPDHVSCLEFSEGLLVQRMKDQNFPARDRCHDALGYASAVMSFDLHIPAGESREISLSNEKIHSLAFDWTKKIPVVQLQAASWGADLVAITRTAAAHILITRDGPALLPGPRRYTRSWIRDAGTMAAALLRMGCGQEVAEFIRWYSAFQRNDGFIPCCVDRDGVDPLVEHDSHGQWLALIADYIRMTGDHSLMNEMWPTVKRAVAYMESIIEPCGLLPVSVSHEGYLAQPVHSFWDDFWALRGLHDAAWLAGEMGHAATGKHYLGLAEKLSAALASAVEVTAVKHGLDTIPASVEWADFDPVATANAVMLFEAPVECNADALARTFDQFMGDWRKKRSGELASMNYTPYEIRVVGALLRLGRRDDALELLRFLLGDCRPRAWNQWPEIAWKDRLAPAHIGDVPHTWIAAEALLVIQQLFAYASESRDALVIAAGLDPAWLDGEGIRVLQLPTIHGPLSYQMSRKNNDVVFVHIEKGLRVPCGGIVIMAPLCSETAVHSLPCTLELSIESP